MSARGDSFDPLAAHKPLPPRPTRQEALEAVLVAADALKEAGDLATATRVREAVNPVPAHFLDSPPQLFISEERYRREYLGEWPDAEIEDAGHQRDAIFYAMRYGRPWNMGEPVPVPVVRANGSAVVRMMREIPRTWREQRLLDDTMRMFRPELPVPIRREVTDFERREVIYSERVRLAGDETVLEHRHIWFQERP